MAKLTLTDLSNLQNETSAVTRINENNSAIETALENTLSRDGTSPNQMNADLDMNSKKIYNLGAPTNPNDALRLQDLVAIPQIIDDIEINAFNLVNSYNFQTKADFVAAVGLDNVTEVHIKGYRYRYTATEPSHLAKAQNTDSGRWFVYAEPVFWQTAITDTDIMNGNSNNAAAAAYAIGIPLQLTIGDATLTIDPVAEAAEDTDDARHAVINNAVTWAGTNIYGNNSMCDILITGTGAIKVNGQVLITTPGSTGAAAVMTKVRMGVPTSNNITAIDWNEIVTGAGVTTPLAHRAGATYISCPPTQVPTTTNGGFTPSTSFPITVDTTRTSNTITGFAATGYTNAAGVLTGVVVTSYGSNAVAEGAADVPSTGIINPDRIRYDLSAGGKSYGTYVVTRTGDAVSSVAVVDGGSGWTSAPTIYFYHPTGTGARGTTTINGSGVITSVTITAGGSGYSSDPVPLFSGGGLPVFTTGVNLGISVVTVTFQDALPANIAVGMPVGLRAITGTNDCGALNGAGLVRSFDTTTNKVSFEWTSIRGSLTTGVVSAGTGHFPPQWIQVRGGYTGLQDEGYFMIAKGGRFETQHVHGAWDPTSTTYSHKADQKFIAYGLLGGTLQNLSGPSIIAGFPENCIRMIHMQSAYLINYALGVAPHGTTPLLLQNGGSMQCGSIYAGGGKIYGILIGDNSSMMLTTSKIGSSGTGIYAAGSRINVAGVDIYSSDVGVSAYYNGRISSPTTGTIDRCDIGVEIQSGGVIIWGQDRVLNSLVAQCTAPHSYDRYWHGGEWISGETDTRMRRTITTNVLPKVGATSGWVVGDGATNQGFMATLPASQTNATIVVPIPWVEIDSTITHIGLIGQIEGTAGVATIQAQLRKHQAVAANPTDTLVGSSLSVSNSSGTDLAITPANSQNTTAFTDTVGSDETFYILITGTTAASTDIVLQGVVITTTI